MGKSDLTGRVRQLAGPAGYTGVSDRDLLARFVAERDEDAFEALVRRHDRLVRSAIARVLTDRSEAADAFQATFLVLLQRARRLDWRASLGPWLYGVAHRVALKLRSRQLRRPGPLGGADLPDRTAAPDLSWREACARLHAELDRLPDTYRLPLLLCYLEGQTREDAASALGVTAGVIKGRVRRGCELLRRRLARHGVTLSAGLLAAVAVPPGARAAGASAVAAFRGPVPPRVGELVREVTVGPLLSRVAWGSVVAVALIGGAALVAAATGARTPTEAVAPPSPRKVPKTPAGERDDPLPRGTTQRFGTSRYRQGTAIKGLAVSADGTRAIATSGSHIHGAVHVFDLTTGRVRLTLARDGSREGEAVAISADGKVLATKEASAVHLRDPATGKELRTIQLPGTNPRTLSDWLVFSPDGKTLAACGDDGATIHLVDTTRGTLVRSFAHQRGLRAVAFSPDGSLLAGGGYDNEKGAYFGRLWDVTTAKELRRFPVGRGGLLALAFSADGKTLAGGGNEARLRLWDVATGKDQGTFPVLRASVRSVAFAPDGKTVAVAAGSMHLYDPATGKERLRIDSKALGLHFAADGKVLTGAVSGAIYRWDPATGRPLTPQAGDSVVEQILVSRDGRRVITRGQDGDAHLWDARTGGHLRTLQATWQRGLALSPDGRFLAWPVADERVKFTEPGQPRVIYTGSRIRLYDIGSARFVERFAGFKGDANYLAFLPDGKTLLTIDYRDGAVLLWNVATGKERRQFRALRETEPAQPYALWRALLSPDGRTLAVTYQFASRGFFSTCAVRLWDLKTGKELHDLAGHYDYVNGLAFSPDGQLLVSGSKELVPFAQKQLKRPANQVFVWDVAAGRRVPPLPDGLPTGAAAAAFASDGRTLATASPDGTIRVWEVATWRLRTTLHGHRGHVSCLTFAPDGQLLSGGVDTTVLAWAMRPPR